MEIEEVMELDSCLVLGLARDGFWDKTGELALILGEVGFGNILIHQFFF